VTVVGITGHQRLTSRTEEQVAQEIRQAIAGIADLDGMSSLAEGADQIFAEAVLELGGELIAVVPARRYVDAFAATTERENFSRLLALASHVVELSFDEPTEEAFWAAGRYIVDHADRMLAVWDGQRAGGLGGTADVVAYARSKRKPVTLIWPKGAERT